MSSAFYLELRIFLRSTREASSLNWQDQAHHADTEIIVCKMFNNLMKQRISDRDYSILQLSDA